MRFQTPIPEVRIRSINNLDTSLLDTLHLIFYFVLAMLINYEYTQFRSSKKQKSSVKNRLIAKESSIKEKSVRRRNKKHNHKNSGFNSKRQNLKKKNFITAETTNFCFNMNS